MSKNVIAAIIGGSLSIVGGVCMYFKGREKGICEFYDEKLEEAYKIIATKDNIISTYDNLLEISTGQTQRLIKMTEKES